MLQRFEHGKTVTTDIYIPAGGHSVRPISPLDKRVPIIIAGAVGLRLQPPVSAIESAGKHDETRTHLAVALLLLNLLYLCYGFHRLLIKSWQTHSQIAR